MAGVFVKIYICQDALLTVVRIAVCSPLARACFHVAYQGVTWHA